MSFRRCSLASVRAVVLAATAVLVSAGAAFAASPLEFPAGLDDFEYTGDLGPGYWADLDPSAAACAESLRQSPIDIRDTTPDRALGPLDLNVAPAPIDLVNQHRTVDGTYANGSTLVFEGETYRLVQFHFHTLSEHTVVGRRGNMELHAVFESVVDGDLAVIGQIFEIGPENDFLAAFDEHLPQMNGDRYTSATLIDLTDAFGDTRHYYTYPGSLTTPPCTPVVTWILLKQWATMSSDQFAAFRDVLGNDFRPLQPRNAREVRSTPGRSVRPRTYGTPRLPVAR